MNITYWNMSRKGDIISGTKKYEDELYTNLQLLDSCFDINITRIQRSSGRIQGSMPFSWLFTYKTFDEDIVHATFQAVAPARYFNKCKNFVISVMDIAPLLYPSTIKDMSHNIQWKFTPKALNKADKIIAISQFTKDEIVRLLNYDEDKISVVYLGVDHSKYKPMNKYECKNKFGLDVADKHILIVSSNLPHKRMDVANKIIEKIVSLKTDVKIIKAGYGEMLYEKGIINVGYVPEKDMPYLFNAADVYVHTSEYEGFGLPILEAMACGVPVVTTNCASIPEIVGDPHYMVDMKSATFVEQFVEKILSMLECGRNNALIRQSKKFTWERTAKETIDVYNELME